MERIARKRRGAGIGLLTLSAAAWAGSLGLRVGSHVLLRRCTAQARASDTGGFGCIAAMPAYGGMTVSSYLLDAGTFGLALGGGHLLGSADGLRAATEGRSLRDRPGQVATGATLMAVGLGVVVASEAVRYHVIDSHNGDLGMLGVTQLGVTSAGVGGALLGHALAWNRVAVQVGLNASREGGGFTLSGRF